MPKRINPRRRPATMADVQRAKDTATADACRVTLAIFFTALLDKEGMGAERERARRVRLRAGPDPRAARGI